MSCVFFGLTSPQNEIKRTLKTSYRFCFAGRMTVVCFFYMLMKQHEASRQIIRDDYTTDREINLIANWYMSGEYCLQQGDRCPVAMTFQFNNDTSLIAMGLNKMVRRQCGSLPDDHPQSFLNNISQSKFI